MNHFKLFWDWDAFRGTIGALLAVILPMISALTPLLQFFGAILGLVLVCYSIYHKRLQIKNIKENKE